MRTASPRPRDDESTIIRRPSAISAIAIARNKIALPRNEYHIAPAGIEPAKETTMRVMETLTGSLLSFATIVLAVGAIIAL